MFYKAIDIINSTSSATLYLLALLVSVLIYSLIFNPTEYTRRNFIYLVIIQLLILIPVQLIKSGVIKHTKINTEAVINASPLYPYIIKYYPEERNIILGNALNNINGSEFAAIDKAKTYENYYFSKYIYANAYKLPDDKLIEFIEWNKYLFRSAQAVNHNRSCLDNIKNSDFKLDYPEDFIKDNIAFFFHKDPKIISKEEFERLYYPIDKALNKEIKNPKYNHIYDADPNMCAMSVLLLNMIAKEGGDRKMDIYRYLYRYRFPPKKFIKP